MAGSGPWADRSADLGCAQGRCCSCPAARCRQEAVTSGGDVATQGAPGCEKRRPSNLERNTRRRGMGDPCDIAHAGGLLDRRCPCPLSPAMAHRTRLQTVEKPHRPEPAAGDRRALGQTLRAGSSSDHSSSRAVRRRTRGLSPLGCRRLTRPGAWRLLRQLAATLLQAIIPQPAIARLRRSRVMLSRHLHESPDDETTKE